MGVPSMGWQAQLAVDPTSTLSSSSECYEFKGEGVKKLGTIINTEGMRGTRTSASERSRTGIYTVGGEVTMHASVSVVRKFLPRVFGTAESGSGPYTYALADTLPTFSAMFARNAKDFQYDGLYVNKMNLRGQTGGLAEIVMDWQGQTETVNAAGTFTALALTEPTEAPWMFSGDTVFKIGGVSYPIFDIDLEIDNQLELGRHMNSLSRTALPSQGRTVTIKTNNPFTSTEAAAIYANAVGGVAVVVVLTNGVYVLTLTMAAVQYPQESPVAGDKGEIKFPLTGIARGVSTTKEIVATLAVS